MLNLSWLLSDKFQDREIIIMFASSQHIFQTKDI